MRNYMYYIVATNIEALDRELELNLDGVDQKATLADSLTTGFIKYFEKVGDFGDWMSHTEDCLRRIFSNKRASLLDMEVSPLLTVSFHMKETKTKYLIQAIRMTDQRHAEVRVEFPTIELEATTYGGEDPLLAAQNIFKVIAKEENLDTWNDDIFLFTKIE